MTDTIDRPYRKCPGCGRDLGLNERGRCRACRLTAAPTLYDFPGFGDRPQKDPEEWTLAEVYEHVKHELHCAVEEREAFARACRGTGAPDEPTPLDALDHLLSTADADKRDVEAVERLARELRAALARAGGEAP